MEHSNVAIDLQALSFAYPLRPSILNEVAFQMKGSEKIGLIGNNGCGKSTLLFLIMGLLQATSGELKLFGKSMTQESDFREARPKLGMLFQNSEDQLFSPTVLEDVAFGPLNLGKSPQEAKAISHSTLKRLHLENLEQHITFKLSGGQKKLVAMATVLAMAPQILLLDEPTSGLDPQTKDHFQDILQQWSGGILVVSHDYEFLRQTTQTIYGVGGGKVNFRGNSEEIHAHYHQHSMGKFQHNHETPS